MRHFICNELEPVAYLIYMAALFFAYSHNKQMRHKILLLFYAAAAMLLFSGLLVKSVLNNWSYNLLFLVNICVFSYYFGSLLQSRKKKNVVVACCIINILLLVYFDVSGNLFTDFNGYAYGVSFITIVVYALFYFHQLLENVTEENLLLNFDFWLVCGYLFYFLGTFFIVIYYENVGLMQKANVWGIQNGILFICSIIMLLAYLRIDKKYRLLHE